MVLRILSLACLISVSLFSLSQESGEAKPHVPVTKTVSKADIYVVGDVPEAHELRYEGYRCQHGAEGAGDGGRSEPDR